MNESGFYESLGRKQAVLDSLNAEYDNLLGILAKVASGEIDPKSVAVDLAGRAWKLRALPVAIDNGFTECVRDRMAGELPESNGKPIEAV